MAKVSELKERARVMEQQGDLAKARAIYEHILKHLEGTAALMPELPMYVKVGDLSLKLGDAAGAVAMYERAAEHYASAGSARSIGALAEKIRRADPTRDDAAVGLGRALLAHGHAGAAAEVALRYARRIERADVASLLAEIAPEADDPTSQGLVESALSILAGPRPSEPAPEPASEVPAPEPLAVSQPPVAVLPEPPHADEPEPRESEPEEEDAASPKLDLPLYSFEPEPAAQPGPSVSESDDGLVIRHGVEEPSVGAPPPETPPPPPAEPDFTAPLPPERVVEPLATVGAAPPAEPPEETVTAAEASPLADEPAFYLPDETGPEAASIEEVRKPQPTPERPSHPGRGRGWPEEPHVLVREPRAKPERRGGLLAAGIALAVIVVGAAAAWALGFLPFGRGGDGDAAEPAPAGQGVAVDSLPTPADSAVAGVTGDTTQFGPIGFNTVTNDPAAQGGDTSLGDTAAVGQGGADTIPALPLPIEVPPAQPAAALPRVVVPPGHAIVAEIVVIPGLEVVSVAETRAGGAPGIMVIQRADDGEIALVATLADFGADTAGRGQVAVRVEGDSSVGDVRVGRYLVQARSLLPPDVLSGLLGRLMVARPVN